MVIIDEIIREIIDLIQKEKFINKPVFRIAPEEDNISIIFLEELNEDDGKKIGKIAEKFFKNVSWCDEFSEHEIVDYESVHDILDCY